MTNPANLKKSILDYAIRGELSAKFRIKFTNLSAYDEIAEFNAKISTLKSQREKLLSNLEKLLKIKPNSRHSERSEESHSLNLDFSPTAQNDSKDKIAQLKRIISKLKTKINSYKTITPLNTAGDFNPPFEIPNSWAWVKLGEICEIKLGKTPPKENASYWTLDKNGYKWVSISDMLDKQTITKTEKFVTKKAKKEIYGNSIARKGTLLLSFKLTIGKTSILGFDGYHNEAIASIIPKMQDKEIMKQFLLTFFEIFTKFSNSTTAIKGETLNKDKLNDLPIPLPPKAEQIYISQVLQNLLKECESYEAKALNLANLQTKFKSQIPKSILDYAVRGKLSAKFRIKFTNLSAYDEINEFNAKISTLKSQREKLLSNLEKLLKTKPKNSDKIKHIIAKLKTKIKSYRTITPLNTAGDFNPPFEIPNSWAWVKLGEICEIYTGDSINENIKQKEYFGQKFGLNYIGTKDVNFDNSINYENGVKIPQNSLFKFKIAKENSVLMCIEGGSAGRKIAILNQNVCFGNKLCCFFSKFIENKTIFYYLQSAEFFKTFSSNLNGIIGGVNIKKLNEILIPLPPKNEQEFIASELEKLLNLCKNL